MDNKDLQIENGEFTRIANKILEELVKTPLLATELAICFFIIRKTYGYNKKEDAISITQFEKGVCRSRMSIVKALKNLQLVNMVILVKKGNSKTSSNIWRFNKYYKTWKLVNRAILVKTSRLVYPTHPTSIVERIQLVKTPIHTKDNTKDNTKEIGHLPSKFIKPTISDIENYCKERKNTVKPQRFYDFYESKGWMVGKNKMKDWKACIRTWENDSSEKNKPISNASLSSLMKL